MFRNKDFLIEHGMYYGCREDTFYFIGSLYDEVKETNILKEKRYLEIKEYLEEHRKDILNEKDYSICLFQSVLNRLQKLPDFKDKTIKIEKENCSDCNIIILNKKNNNDNDNKELPHEFSKIAFKNGEKEKDNDNNWKNKSGIYGIFEGNKILYIGKTTRSFEKRFQEHLKGVRDTDADKRLYKVLQEKLKDGKDIYFMPLVIIENLQMKNKRTINDKELKCMELSLITALKPECNIEGTIMPYNFR
jgi:hypothetical protein